MTLTYTWAITGLKKLDDPFIELNDIIVQTYWTCTGKDEDGVTGVFVGATPFDPDQVDPNNFTRYTDLTESQVLQWIQDIVQNEEMYWNHIQRQINKQIAEKKNTVTRVTENELPWSN